MNVSLLTLAVTGVVAWLLLLAAPEKPRSILRLVVEALSVEAVVSTLVSVALVSFDAFRVDTALAVAAFLPLAALARRGVTRPRGLLRSPFALPEELATLAILCLVVPVALPRLATLRMDSDVGVYAGRAIHHLEQGTLRGVIPGRAQLEGELLRSFDRDNLHWIADERVRDRAAYYLPGTYVPRADPNAFDFQFYPGWPLAMAQWAGIFGLPELQRAGLFAFGLAVLLFGLLLEDRVKGLVHATGVALFASSPLLVFFSKYTTTEAFLLFLFLFTIHFLARGGSAGALLAASGFLLLVVTHVSTFLYVPLVLLVGVAARRSGSRPLALFSTLAFAALLAGVPLGLFFSPTYVADVYAISFAFLPTADPGRAGLAAVLLLYLAGLAFSALALRRAYGGLTTPRPFEMRPREEALLPRALRLLLLMMAGWTAYRGYQLGWTDRFVHDPLNLAAWTLRSQYAGTGWKALLHLDVVSMALATGVIGLPALLVQAVWRPRRLCGSGREGFLLAAALWSLCVYTFFRVDTPVNYYASRYYIPVFVPSVMLLLGVGLATMPRLAASVLALAGIAFNLTYDAALYRQPGSNEQTRFLEDVVRGAEGARVLFVRNDLRTLQLLAVPFLAEHRLPVVNVASPDEGSARQAMKDYSAQLKVREAAVLSTRPPSDGPYKVLRLDECRMTRDAASASLVFYPRRWECVAQDYYLRSVTFTGFYTLAPCRLVDTRRPTGSALALPGGTSRRFPAAGSCGIPVGATALAVNVTVVSPTVAGHLSLFPGDQAPPPSSTVSYAAAQTRATSAVVGLDAAGGLAAYVGQTSGSVHLVVDVTGYFQ